MNLQALARSFHFGVVTYRPGGQLGPRWQPRLQLVLIHRGSVTIEVSRQRRRLVAGEMTLLLPDNREQFWFDPSEPTRHSWAEGADPLVDEATMHWLREAPKAVTFSDRMEQLISMGVEARQRSAEPFQDRFLQSLGPPVFGQFLIDAGLQPPQQLQLPEAVRRALRIIAQEYASPLDLPGLAQRSGVSPQHLMRLFRANLNTSPIRKLWEVRSQEAERLIGSTGLPLTQIAEQAGYQNVYHLSRHIRERTGLSPRQLRTSRWGAS